MYIRFTHARHPSRVFWFNFKIHVLVATRMLGFCGGKWEGVCYISASSVITYTSKNKIIFSSFLSLSLSLYIYICSWAEKKTLVLTFNPLPLTPSLTFPGPRALYKNLISLYALMVSFVTLIISLEWGAGQKRCERRRQCWYRSWGLGIWLLVLCRTLSYNWIYKQYVILLAL